MEKSWTVPPPPLLLLLETLFFLFFDICFNVEGIALRLRGHFFINADIEAANGRLSRASSCIILLLLLPVIFSSTFPSLPVFELSKAMKGVFGSELARCW